MANRLLETPNATISELNIELCARELSLEWPATAKDDFQHQSTQLTKKLEGTCSSHCRLSLSYVFH
jgi:hypothetical protein